MLGVMDQRLKGAYVAGYERVVAWADLLDQINVFPVADADTGRNLKISLAPLRQFNGGGRREIAEVRKGILDQLRASAVGNSGNIAVRFLSDLIAAPSLAHLYPAVKAGRDHAWQAVMDPREGTMLTVIDRLTDFLARESLSDINCGVSRLIEDLKQSVEETVVRLPVLKSAGVVDSGALGVFIFLEAFFRSLTDHPDAFLPLFETFEGKLHLAPTFQPDQAELEGNYCIDTLIHLDPALEQNTADTIERLAAYGQSVVVGLDGDETDQAFLKVHLHTQDRKLLRRKLEDLGNVVQWSEEDIAGQVEHHPDPPSSDTVHVMTDAAGSISGEQAKRLSMTVLDSLIIIGDRALPETLWEPATLYAAMRKGVRVSTAQASNFQRHQSYQRMVDQYRKVLYLCVGSVYTGNYDAACAWKEENDPDDRLVVIDTRTASGSLGIIALAVGQYAREAQDAESVIAFARQAIAHREEYLFLDRLKYLAAGGRLSKTSGVIGDLLHMKPVISPTGDGAQKIGVVRSAEEQLQFALKRLNNTLTSDSAAYIMLEYSDNQDWVADRVKGVIQHAYPAAEIILEPLSLTSGAHMGPGTWGLAFLPHFREPNNH